MEPRDVEVHLNGLGKRQVNRISDTVSLITEYIFKSEILVSYNFELKFNFSPCI